MALREWDYDSGEDRPRRPLRVVDPESGSPPPRGHPVAALWLVAILIGVLGAPAIHAALQDPPPPREGADLPPSVVEIDALDPVTPMPGGDRPTSGAPVGGLAFVRCTSLWSAWADGSHQHKILAMSGISSPTFSPNARTIAFLLTTAEGQEIWMVGADGSHPLRVGAIAHDGRPVAPLARALTWSPQGDELAFALTDAREPGWSGSAIWTVDIDSGTFESVGYGWPAPFWVKGHLGLTQWEDNSPVVAFTSGMEREERKWSQGGDVLSLGAQPSGWWLDGSTIAFVRATDTGSFELVLRDWWARSGTDRLVTDGPRGYSVSAMARPTVAQDGSRISVDLYDDKGERDIGVLDPSTGDWTVLDYAWEPSASPVPTSTGPLAAQRAVRLTGDLMSSWNRKPRKAALAVGGRRNRSLFPGKIRSWNFGPPVRDGDTWTIAGTVIGRAPSGFAFRHLRVVVAKKKTAVTAVPHATSPLTKVTTVEDALDFLAGAVTVDYLAPELPEGARLDDRHHQPVSVWSWRGQTTATLNVLVPTGAGKDKPLVITYGDVYFSFGCGTTTEPEPTTVGGFEAMRSHYQGAHQVIWPATPDATVHSEYSVYGDLPEGVVRAVAESMAAAR